MIETPKSSRDRTEKERERKERKRKAPKFSSYKGEVNILRGEICFIFKNQFQCDPIFSPSIVPFQKSFPNSLRNFS
jgi:hypothetical protein